MVIGAGGSRWRTCLCVLLGILLSLAVQEAKALPIGLTVVGSELEVGQATQLRPVTQNERPLSIPQFVVRDGGLQVTYMSQGVQVEYNKGQLIRSYEFTYRVEAVRVGTYTLGPVVVDLPSQKSMTPVVMVQVTAAQEESERGVQVYAGFLEEEAFVGQVILYRRGLRSSYPIQRDMWTEPPMKGVIPTKESLPAYREYTVDGTDGRVFVKEDYFPRLVFEAGDHEVPGAVVRVLVSRNDRRRRDRNEVMVTSPQVLKVSPLPTAPPGYVGLVGEYTIRSELEAQTARTGDSVKWVVTIEGQGSLEGFDLPVTTHLEGARVYDGTPSVSAGIEDGQFISRARYERVLVPVRAGSVQVPNLEIVTFSPSKKAFVTHRLEHDSLEVSSGQEGSGDFQSFVHTLENPLEWVQGEPAYDGVRPVWTEGRSHTPFLGGWLVGAMGLAGMPILMWLSWIGWQFGGEWLEQRRRSRKAPEMGPLARIRQLPDNPQSRASALDEALRLAVFRAVDGQAMALDLQGCMTRLEPDRAIKATALLDQLGRVRFANAQLEPQLVSAICALVTELEETRETA